MSTSAETSNITTSNDTTNNDIIIPPPDIRAVVNKTAQFVAKNGRQFESRILSSSEGSTPKFAFMSTSSPYNPYYESRIIFFNNGGDIEEEQNIIQRNREEDERALEEASRPTSQTVTVTVVDEVKVDRATVDVVGRAILKARKVMQDDTEKGKKGEKGEKEEKEKEDNKEKENKEKENKEKENKEEGEERRGRQIE